MEVCTVVHITRQGHQGASMVWPWLLVEVGRIEGLGVIFLVVLLRWLILTVICCTFWGAQVFFVCFTFKNVCGHLMFKLVMLTFPLHCACS